MTRGTVDSRCATFVIRLLVAKVTATLGAKEAPMKGDQLGALERAFVILVSRYLYVGSV